MKRELLEILRCPYCGTDFQLIEIYGDCKEEIKYGLIKCECDVFPILDGILILKNTPMKGRIIAYLKNNELSKAILVPFLSYSNDACKIADFVKLQPFGEIIERSMNICFQFLSSKKYRVYSNVDIPFFKLIKNNVINDYYKYRFSSPTLWVVYPFIPLLKSKRKRILDVCCGMGHVSFILSEYIEPDELISVDGEFISLYLAKKYFSNSQFINIDVNNLLPFKDGVFSSVIMVDAIQFVDARMLLANELKRILEGNGILLLLHVHNLLVENIAAGKPLSPSSWQALFDDFKLDIFPEGPILNQFIREGTLDLSKIYSKEEINLSESLILISRYEKKRFTNIWDEILRFKNNLIINPIYNVKETRDKLLLTINFPSEFFREECPIAEQVLPSVLSLDKESFKDGLHTLPSDELYDLMRNFVIINAPINLI